MGSPWLREETARETEGTSYVVDVDEDLVLGAAELARGPVVPLHTDSVRAVALQSPPPGTGLIVQGVHGGAGASTVARLLGDEAMVSDTHWRPGDHLASGTVVLVARMHGHGLSMALSCARAWSHGRVGERSTLLGLVLVDDAPKPPKELIVGGRALSGAVPRLWRLPWVEHWRASGPALEDRQPRRVRTTVNSIIREHRALALEKGTS